MHPFQEGLPAALLTGEPSTCHLAPNAGVKVVMRPCQTVALGPQLAEQELSHARGKGTESTP